MLKTILGGLAVLVAVLAALFWWMMLSGSTAPKTAPDLFPIADWRDMIADTEVSARPTELTMVEIGSDRFPGMAAQAGAFGTDFLVSYTSFIIDTPDGAVIVGGAVDKATADEMTQAPENAAFYPDRYNALTDAMAEARAVVITHEHIDHVMAIARHPAPEKLAPRLMLNVSQRTELPQFAQQGGIFELIDALNFNNSPPALSGKTEMIAPGIVIVPTPGHTPGSQAVYVQLQDGREYLLIGDIVWTMSNIADLKTRPVLTQYLVFDPNEDREAVKEQVRALYDLTAAEPDLILVPSHDRVYLQGLVAAGQLSE